MKEITKMNMRRGTVSSDKARHISPSFVEAAKRSSRNRKSRREAWCVQITGVCARRFHLILVMTGNYPEWRKALFFVRCRR